MRPRRFPTGTEELNQVCGDLKRVFEDKRPRPGQLDGLAKFLITILALAGLCNGLGWSRDWLMAHSIKAITPYREVAQPREWVIGERRRVTLEDGQPADVVFKGQIPLGTVLRGVKLGDMYKHGNGYWVWWIPVGATQPNWIDP